MQGVIVGYGNMGHIHEKAITANGSEVLAIVDPDPAMQTVRYSIFDTVCVTLHYKSFDAQLHSSWTANNKNPIEVRIRIEDESGGLLGITCTNYIAGAKENPYDLQMKSFLASLSTTSPDSLLQAHLDATAVAIQIAERAHAYG